MTDTAIMIRIKKLLALGSNNSNQAEAEAAMAKAAALMQQHNLDRATINAATLDAEDPFTKDTFQKAKPKFGVEERMILNLLQKHFNVRFILTNDRRAGVKQFVIIGRTSNVEVATYVYEYLSGTFARLYRAYCRAEGRKLNEKGLKESFYRGLFFGLNEKMKQERTVTTAADAPTSTTQQQEGLVAVEEDRLQQAMERWFPSTRKAYTHRNNHLDGEAMHAGHAAGSNININPGVRGAAGPLQLK